MSGHSLLFGFAQQQVKTACWIGHKGRTYQSLGGSVKGVSVVAAELGVDTLEGGVTVGLGLLDTVELEKKAMVSVPISLKRFRCSCCVLIPRGRIWRMLDIGRYPPSSGREFLSSSSLSRPLILKSVEDISSSIQHRSIRPRAFRVWNR